jgi:hypothetical protein
MTVGAGQQSYRCQRQLPCQIFTVPVPLLLLESTKRVLDRAYKTRGGRRGAVTLLPAVFWSEFLGFGPNTCAKTSPEVNRGVDPAENFVGDVGALEFVEADLGWLTLVLGGARGDRARVGRSEAVRVARK